ncbi:SBBP repeat-containing protein [Sorangium sp. So ce1389]|uniref:SBBP repeat-containing protein n=1 Tax=Sorangium sp. So ce1389 TaxID=3133336 RepID=UPI003F62671D
MGGGVLRPGGTEDALLAKYDAAGNHTLSKLFGDDSNQHGGGHIVFDADCNMFFVVSKLLDSGWLDVFLVKLDSAGNPLWSKELNAGYEADWYIRSIAVDPTTGGVVLMGRYYGEFDLGGGLLPYIESDYDPTRGYVAKFDAMGDFVWSEFSPKGSGRYDPSGMMVVDASGQIVIAADDSDIVDDGSGKFARFELARLDASGNELWTKYWKAPLHYGSASDHHRGLIGIAVDGDGSVFLAGNARCDLNFGGGPLVGANCSSDNAFVAKFDVHGGHLWSRLIEGSLASTAVSLGVDALGNAFVAGSVTGTLDADGTALGEEDGAERQFVVRLDRDGDISWSHILSPEISRVHDLAVGPEGNVAIMGQDASAVDASIRGANIVTKLNVAAP